jgi:hypothetical protein
LAGFFDSKKPPFAVPFHWIGIIFLAFVPFGEKEKGHCLERLRRWREKRIQG